MLQVCAAGMTVVACSECLRPLGILSIGLFYPDFRADGQCKKGLVGLRK